MKNAGKITCIYLNTTVMEEVPKPRESSVLVAFVEELDLLPDDVFSLRTCVLVIVHHQPNCFLLLIFCTS